MRAILVGCPPQVARVLTACSVEVGASFADARSAIDATRLSQGEKVLCVMHVPTRGHLALFKLLRESFVGRPLLALVDSGSPPELLFAVGRAGAGTILPLPLDPEELRSALDVLKATHSPPLPVASRRVIAVTGATGGCGATTLALNLAYEVATQFDRTCILVDLARGGMATTCLDLEVRNTFADLVCDMRSLDDQFLEQTLLTVTDNLRILPAPRLEEEPLHAAPDDILAVLDMVKQRADVVILDLPIHSDVRFEAFSYVNQAVIVAEQTVPSIRALDGARNLLEKLEGIRQVMVINRYNPKLTRFHATTLKQLIKSPVMATIANDYNSVSNSLNEGIPLRQHAPGSRVVQDLHELAKMLITPTPPPAPEVKQQKGFARIMQVLVG